jgi:hypothetical protein
VKFALFQRGGQPNTALLLFQIESGRRLQGRLGHCAKLNHAVLGPETVLG